MLKGNIDVINERVLNSVGKCNYNEYMLLTNGKEIDEILDNNSPVYEMYKYKDKLLDSQKDIAIDMNNLKRSLENVFLDYLTDKEFKTVKDILDKNIGGWDIKKLLNIHKQHKYNRIFSLLTIKYNDWLKC